jgi:hypothetical protein
MWIRQLRTAFAGFSVLLASCSLFVDLEEQPGPSSNVDAGLAIDSGSVVDVIVPLSDSGSEAGNISDARSDVQAFTPGLERNGSFEEGSGGCGTAWTAGGSAPILTSSSVAYSGARSCQACGGDFSGITQAIDIVLQVGDQVTVDARVRAADGADASPTAVSLEVITYDANGFLESGGSNSPQLAAQWIPIQGTLSVTKTASRVRISVYRSRPEGSCFLIDDVRLTKN